MYPVEKWLYENNFNVQILSIDKNATWDVSEIIYIDRARQHGVNLLNVLRGGRDTPHDLWLSQGGDVTKGLERLSDEYYNLIESKNYEV